MNTIQDILYKSEAYLNIKKQKVFLNSLNIYKGNYNELVKSFDKHKKLDLASLLDTYHGRKKLYRLHDKISRLLHNYLASAFSLIQASSVYYHKCFKPKNQLLEYEYKIEHEVNSKPVKMFIVNLRTYLQHKEFPNIITATVYEPYPSLDYNSYVKFQVADLLNYKKWSPLSKKYIKENAKSLIIPKAIDEFHYIFMSFTDWFVQQINECLNKDKKEVERLKLKMNIENLKILIRLYFGLPEKNIERFENSFLPKFNKGEKIAIKREKNPNKRAEKILKIINKYVNTNKDFEYNVIKLYS